MSLKELAIKFNSDKWYRHSYINFYENLFRGMKPKLLLEIGIGYQDMMKPFVPEYVHGSSMKMWGEFFPDSEIIVIDINHDAIRDLSMGRMQAMYCDQSRPDHLISLIGQIGRPDIIIDDGSHVTEHQIISAITLGPYLRKGGIYVVEDVQEPEVLQSEIGGEIHRFQKCPDDCLLVLRK